MKIVFKSICLLSLAATLSIDLFGQQSADLLSAASVGDNELVQKLLASGANVETRDKDGVTALTKVAAGGYTQTMEALLKARADVNAKSNKGWTALMIASFTGKLESVKFLLDRNANASLANNDGVTALDLASKAGNAEMVQLLKTRDDRLVLRDSRTGLIWTRNDNGHNILWGDALRKRER